MPLYKKKPIALVGIPEDLKAKEDVFQIRYTKEIFRSYNEYLKRINLYRKRVWTCKATGKGNLTYEEALFSEKKAAERIQSIPVECIVPVLRDVQFSMLNLKDLVDSIAAKFQGPYSESAEVYGRKDGSLHLCKIINVIEDDDITQYEVEWLDNDHKASGKELINDDELSSKDPPFSKRLLKSFIRDSTYRNMPWVLHENLAKKHGISTDPPPSLRSNISIQNGLVICCRKRKRSEDKQKHEEKSENNLIVYKRRNKLTPAELSMIKARKANGGNENEEAAQSIKYPIDDLLVQPTEEDRLLTERPYPCKDFGVTMDCVGNLLMVWDFCTSYGKLLNLSPFSLEDFENSICYKDSTPVLIVESCSALLLFLLDDGWKFFTEMEDKKRRPKITQTTWTAYLCDFIGTSCPLEMAKHTSTIKQGQFAQLEVCEKLAIFEELVTRALETDTLREKLDEFIEERQALAATRRDEAIWEGRKKREEKERKRLPNNGKEVKELTESGESDESTPNVVAAEKNNKKVRSQQNHSSRSSENGNIDNTSNKNGKKHKVESNNFQGDGNLPSKREIHKLMKNEIKESIEAKSLEQRKEFLEREIEKRVIRNNPLGKDKDYHRYWFFRHDGRVFVEIPDSSQWGYYQTKEELDELLASFNTKGVRERALKQQLQKFYKKICAEMQKRTKEDEQSVEMEEALVRKSTRVRAPPKKEKQGFLKYVNKWKEV